MNEKKFAFTTHIQKIKKRLVRSFIAVGVGFFICYGFSDSIYNVLAAPLIKILPGESTLIFHTVAEAFFNYMKVGFVAGLMLASPFVLYQIWAFISHRLNQGQKRYVFTFIIAGSSFFALGILFGYFVALPFGCKFLLKYSSQSIKPLLDMTAYLSFSVRFLMVFGLAFEFPVLLLILTRIGVINAEILAERRRYAILVIFIFALAIAPPDLISQVLMALPLMGLYEVSIFLCKIFGSGPGRILMGGAD